MERIEISTSNTSLSEIVKHVSQERVSIEVSEDHVPLAMIVPIDKGQSMHGLDHALRKCIRLGEDAALYANDVLEARESIGELDDPWES